MSLRWINLDLNAYFASVEQQEQPHLRGRPVGVIPTLAETTSCIAASYEAKRFGVKTGTLVRDARRMCPGIQLVEARPQLYIRTHHQIIAAVDRCIPVSHAPSIDEVMCSLLGKEREPEEAKRIAGRIKDQIATDVGKYLLCSIGIAPNRWLAKIATDMQKPNGLTVIQLDELPQRLFELQLVDLPGIGHRMEKRLNGAGITRVEQLCHLSPQKLKPLWKSEVLANRWWRLLRGEDFPDPPTYRRSVGHSRVLAPQLRHDDRARAVLVCLLHKAAARLRRLGCWAGSLTVSVSFLSNGGGWHLRRAFPHCRDTLALLQVFADLWRRKPDGRPLKVGVVLGDLSHARNVAPSLFEEDRNHDALADAMDQINQAFGKDVVFFGGMIHTRDQNKTRIAFTRIPELDE